MMRAVLAALSILAFGSPALPCTAQGGCTDNPDNAFYVSGSTVSLPIGAFLLVRKQGHIGAIRLTALNVFGTLGTGTAAYESYFHKDESEAFTVQDPSKIVGDITIKPLNFFLFPTGHNRARIGKWSFLMALPNTMSLWTYRGSQRDYGFEFAETSACRPADIISRDPTLRWFRFDANTSFTTLVRDLPK